MVTTPPSYRRARRGGAAAPRGSAASTADRSSMPVIHDLRIVRSQVEYRASTGHEHRVQLDNATLAAADPDQPVQLDASGSYNNVPLTFAAKLGSYSALRDAGAKFPLDLNAVSGANTLDFRGTVTDLLHAAGIEGQITLAVPAPAALLDLAGAKAAPNLPIQFSGRLTRQGGRWRLDEASGALDGNRFDLPLLQFVEGGAGRPDVLTGKLDVPRLATTVLGRHVSLESLGVSLDKSLHIELRGARLGNIPGGSNPAMATLARLSAELEAEPLMSGSVVVQRAEVDGLSLLLEHNARRQANWHFGRGARRSPRRRRPHVPPARKLGTLHRLQIAADFPSSTISQSRAATSCSAPTAGIHSSPGSTTSPLSPPAPISR